MSSVLLSSIKLILMYLMLEPCMCDDITTAVFGQNDYQYLPAAFGDFNADKLTDVFVIEKMLNGSYIVKILLSFSKSPFLRPSTDLQCRFDFSVKSVVPSDFDGDGAMDILVISLQGRAYESYVLYGSVDHLSCPENYTAIAAFKTQPLLIDYNGDMIADLFGEGIDGNRYFWVFSKQRSEPLRIPMKSIDDDSPPFQPLRHTGGHAFIDIDEDLAADLWVSTEHHFEFWPSSDGFETLQVIDIPNVKAEVIGQSVLFDLDLDGNIEVILPLCSDSDCNQSFLYVYEFTNISGHWYDLKVNFKDMNEVVWSFPSKKMSFLYTNTITPRIGDFNLDGYPDILITVFHDNTPKVILLVNTACSLECQHPRTFLPLWDTFNNWPNSVMGTFFDFFEDGALDVLLVNTSSNGKTYTVGAYKDSVGYDAMFLKVLVLTGVCYTDCTWKGIPYGTNQPGPSITYSMTSAEGGIQTTRATQMSQSSHFALQLPFSLLGLGRNWNFIDDLHVGISLSRAPFPANATPSFSSKTNDRTATFTQIIPNSQLVVIPYPEDMPSLWTTKLFITPSSAMIQTAGALIATCLFVAVIIGGLHFREKQQDKQERRQQAQKFHFDAM